MTENDVKKYAALAHIQLTEEEVRLIAKDLAKVFEDFKSIQSIDTSGLEPLYNGLIESIKMREDDVVEEENLDSLIEGAPEVVGRLFKVPPVVG